MWISANTLCNKRRKLQVQCSGHLWTFLWCLTQVLTWNHVCMVKDGDLCSILEGGTRPHFQNFSRLLWEILKSMEVFLNIGGTCPPCPPPQDCHPCAWFRMHRKAPLMCINFAKQCRFWCRYQNHVCVTLRLVKLTAKWLQALPFIYRSFGGKLNFPLSFVLAF